MAALIAVQLLFSVHYSVAIVILGVIEPAAWVVLRVLGAGVVLALLIPITRRRWPRGVKNWIELAVLGILGVVVRLDRRASRQQPASPRGSSQPRRTLT